jgi:DNA polymerase-3 subunit epsilon
MIPMIASDDLEAMARALEASGDYRVVRRLRPRAPRIPLSGTPIRHGLVVDVETTGLDPSQHEIIELAMTPFSYGLDGTIFTVGESFQGMQQPRAPIPDEISAITGITNSMVAGQTIDLERMASVITPASLIIAHNAAFDRRFLERFSPLFIPKPWACSLVQIDWAGEGFEGTKLGYLAQAAGFFYERHRAVHDCLATIELLAPPLPRSRVSGLSRLLDAARLPSVRIWAENSPYESKDALKARGYRWNGEPGSHPRAWFIDVPEAMQEAELMFLKTEIYRRELVLPMRRIDAHDRFSDRI